MYRIQELANPEHAVTSIKFENRKLQELLFRPVESRQSNSVPEDKQEM